jgi:diguanylate cyclase (GGDEF)-like protein
VVRRLKTLKSALFHLIFPGGVVIAVAVALWQWSPQALFPVSTVVSFFSFVAVATAGVCWRYSHSRLFLVLLVLALSAVLDLKQSTVGPPVYAFWQQLIPLNLMWLALLRERQFCSLATAGRICLLLVQPLVLYGILVYKLSWYTALNTWSWSIVWAGWTVEMTLPVLLVCLVFLVVLARHFWRNNGENAALVWVLIVCCFAFYGGDLVPDLYWYALGPLLILVTVLEQSYALAFRDELTGLPSRRALSDQLFRRRRRYGVALVDIDHFKKVNDTHGHDVGDQVLKLVATQLAMVGGGGRAYRYGGEEFIVLFRHDRKEETTRAVEQLRQRIAKTPFTVRQRPRPTKRPRHVVPAGKGQQTLHVTVSIGLSWWEKGLDGDAVIKRADQALYRAKKAGRNRVIST